MNGYTTYEAWNTALWIDNTEALQGMANDWINDAHEHGKNWADDELSDLMAARMALYLETKGKTHTGDGVLWTLPNLKEYFTTNL